MNSKSKGTKPTATSKKRTNNESSIEVDSMLTNSNLTYKDTTEVNLELLKFMMNTSVVPKPLIRSYPRTLPVFNDIIVLKDDNTEPTPDLNAKEYVEESKGIEPMIY